jgi:hypothetical protein
MSPFKGTYTPIESNSIEEVFDIWYWVLGIGYWVLASGNFFRFLYFQISLSISKKSCFSDKSILSEVQQDA